jgi:hypothetical protein
MSDVELSFEIGAYSPQTFPMERLGKYISDIGAMLGEEQFVQFVALEAGSTKIVHRVKAPAVASVEQRIANLAAGVEKNKGSNDAFDALNKRLKEDNAEGLYRRKDTGAVILKFPGIKTKEPEIIGPIEQASVIDGILIRIGGRDETVPVSIQNDNVIYKCTATRELARQLGSHLFGNELRLTGIARWQRHETEGWQLDRFKIESFIPMVEKSLLESVIELRATKSEWVQSADWAEHLEDD